MSTAASSNRRATPSRHCTSDLIDVDAVIPVTYCTTDRAGLQSQYQEFIERTRYLRRGDYVFSDILSAPLVLENWAPATTCRFA